MKKTLLFSACALFICTYNSYSQCTPNYQGSMPGIQPDSLPHANVDEGYNETIHVLVQEDSVITEYNGNPLPQPVTADLNWVRIDDVDYDGLDAKGFVYAVNPSDGVFYAGDQGCLLLNGPAPTSDMIGTYKLVVYLTMSYDIPDMGLYGVEDTASIRDYYLVIDDVAGIYTISSAKFQVEQNVPNPFSDITEIRFTSPIRDTYALNVYNLLGDLMMAQTIQAKVGLNSLQFSAGKLPSGIYTYSINNGSATVMKRMVIK